MRDRAGGVPSAGGLSSVRFLARVLLALIIGSSHRYRPFAEASPDVDRFLPS